MGNIELDFQNAKRQADKLDELAQKLERLAKNQWDGTLLNLSEQWRGNNATVYLRKGMQLENDMAASAKKMRLTASKIRSTAKKIYDAEIYAKKLAENRVYRGK